MNYLDWNEKLYKYFFSNKHEIIYLSITRKVLADISGFNETAAFLDFKSAINTFPNTDAEKNKFPFLVNNIRNYNPPNSLLNKAANFKQAWREGYNYVPNGMLAGIKSWPVDKTAPYIAYLAVLVLMIDDPVANDNAYWTSVRGEFGNLPAGYGDIILDLFDNLKVFDPRFDFYSIYSKKRFVGTIYSQLPLTTNEINDLQYFFVLKDISYAELLEINDSVLLTLLIKELDSSFVNELTIDALHSDNAVYDNFKKVLPYTIKKLIPEYVIDDQLKIDASDKFANNQARKEYPFLVGFKLSSGIPHFPLNLFLKHGPNSGLMEKAENGILEILDDNRPYFLVDNDKTGKFKIKISSERSIAYSSKEGVGNDNFNRKFILKPNLTLRAKAGVRNIIVFVPGDQYDLNGCWIESPNNIIPVNSICYILWNDNLEAAAAATFLTDCSISIKITNRFLPEGWKLNKFAGVKTNAKLKDFIIEDNKTISLIGGCKADSYKNEYFDFCPPKIVAINFLETDQFCISYMGLNKTVSYLDISNTIIDRNSKNKLPYGCEIRITPLNKTAPYATFKLIKSEINSTLSELDLPKDLYFPNIAIGAILNVNGQQQNMFTITQTNGTAKPYTITDPIVNNGRSYCPSADYLMYALSYKKQFSYNQIVSLIESLSEDADDVVPYFIVDSLFTQGHIKEIGFEANLKDKNFEIIKSRLAKIPSHSNIYQLIGARSCEWMKKFIEDAENDNLGISILQQSQKFLPQPILIKILTPNINHLLRAYYVPWLNTYPGANYLNSVQNFDILNQTPLIVPLIEDSRYQFDRFNEATFYFQKCNILAVNIQNTSASLYRMVRTYRFNSIPERYFLKLNNIFYSINSKQDAIYYYLANTATNYEGWIFYDSKNKLLAIPAVLNFPDNLRKALSLLGCFSKIVNISKNVMAKKPDSFKDMIINNQFKLSTLLDTNHTKLFVFENMQDFIADIIEKKLNKKLIKNIDLSNL